MVQTRYVRVMEAVCRSATSVITQTDMHVNVHKFFRLVPATKYVHLLITQKLCFCSYRNYVFILNNGQCRFLSIVVLIDCTLVYIVLFVHGVSK